MKLAVVGAGSTYTPELVDGLVRMRELLPLAELALHDVDPARLELLAAMAGRMLEHAGMATAITATADLDAAVDGSAAVVVQLRVGGQAARIVDESLPASRADLPERVAVPA